MAQLLIIADDFTGALDTGVQFATCGADIRVTTAREDLGVVPACDVLVVNAETRHLSAQDAYRIVKKIALQAKAMGTPYTYKKTDSALRGNIGAELSALLQAGGTKQLPFLPAFPKIGRTTRNGVHYIDGLPVAESVFGKDPFEPVRHSALSQLIAEQSGVDVCCSPALRDGVPTPTENGILVFDADDETDLAETGRRLLAEGRLTVMAGCAGFGAVLPSLLGLGGGTPTDMPKLDPMLLVICGSVNPITVAQMDHAEKAGFYRVRLTPEQKLSGNYWLTEQGAAEFKIIEGILEEHPYRIIDTNGTDGNASVNRYAAERGLSTTDIRVSVAQSVGYMVSRLFSNPRLGTLMVTGGDTLLQCMDYMGVHALQPICELDPGVVLSRFTYRGYTRYVISKSGGFGETDLLMRISDKLRATR